MVQFQFHHPQLSTTTFTASATAVFISAASGDGFPGIVLDGIYLSGTGTASVVTLSASGVVVGRFSYPDNGGAPLAPVHIKVNQGEDLQMHASGTGAVTVNFHRAMI